MAKKVEVDLKIIIGIIALVIIAAVGSAYSTFLIFGRGSAPSDQNQAASASKRDIGPIFDAGEFMVNLMPSGAQPHYIRTGIMMEGSRQEVIDELEKRTPQVRDLVIKLLRLCTIDELRSVNGLDDLRAKIIDGVNDLMISGEVIDLYFVDLIVQ